MLDQVGFLGESPLNEQSNLSAYIKTKKTIGIGHETLVPHDEEGEITFTIAKETKTTVVFEKGKAFKCPVFGVKTIDESLPYPLEVPSDFFSVVTKWERYEKTGALVHISDPCSEKNNVSVTLIIKSKEPVPLFRVGDVLRVHRGLLYQRAENHIVLMAGTNAAWVVFTREGKVECSSSSNYSFNELDEALIKKYADFSRLREKSITPERTSADLGSAENLTGTCEAKMSVAKSGLGKKKAIFIDKTKQFLG